jgi:galactokinase
VSECTAFAPGRVNLIGEHTDYNQGLALPFAIERGVTVRAEPIPAARVEAHALDLGEADSFPLGCQPEPAHGWRAFLRGAIAELGNAGVRIPGARLTITGTLPRGAGLSSSAALEVSLVLVLTAIAKVPEPDRTALAKLCSRVENEWAGARTGLLDQLASLYGQAVHALWIDFRNLNMQPVPLQLGGHRLVTLESGSPHVNADSGYNQRTGECARACELLGIESLRDATLEMATQLPDPLNRRARHVVSENLRVEAAVRALTHGDCGELGRLLDQCQASLRDDYEVSTPRVDAAVARLKQAGALGARVIGGGFGGHVLGLMPPGTEPPPDALQVSPGPGARLLDCGPGG